MECEICGADKEKVRAVVFEGMKIMACFSCQPETNEEKKVWLDNYMKKAAEKQLAASHAYQPNAANKKPKQPQIKDFELVEGFGRKIRAERQKKSLSLEDFAKAIKERESNLRHIENEKFLPDYNLAKKIEKFLGLSLIEKEEM